MNPREPALLKLFEILGKEATPDPKVRHQLEETAIHLILALKALDQIANTNYLSSLDVYLELSNQTGMHILPPRFKSLLEEPDVEGRTPLYLAARNGYFQVLKILLSFGIDPNIPNKITGITP